MRNKIAILLVISVVLFGDFALNAQSYPIQITLIKKPPHLMKFDDYEDFSNQIFITAVNTSANKQEFNLNFHATGPNGLTVDAESFLDESIILDPGEVLTFDGSEFEDYGISGLTENNIQPASERKYLAYNRVLREGRYTFCLTAIVPNNPKKFLSDPNEGCDYFDTKYGEPPFIVNPEDQEAITATDPAILNVVWTHNTIGAPSSFDYALKIVDITKYKENPIEIIEQPGVPVVFEDEFEGQFFAGLTDIDLEEDHRYAMRVTAKDPDGNMKFENGGKSNVVVFTYQKGFMDDPVDTTNTVVDNTPPADSTHTSNEPPSHAGPSECGFNADVPSISSMVATSSLSVGDVLTIGRFSMEVKSSTAGPNNTFTGTGEILLPFLNNIKVLTEFSNIQKNADNQIFEGVVNGKEDRSFPYAMINTGIGKVPGMTAEQKDQLKDFLATGNRLLSLYNGDETIGLPFGIDNEVADNSVTVGIMKMNFTPFGASLDAMMSVNIPSLEDNMLHDLSLGVMDLTFSPEGLSEQAKLYLGRDLTVSESNGNELIFGGLEDAGTDWNQITFAEWDCGGFKCLNVALDYKFSRDVIVPDGLNGTPGAGNVQAHTNITMCSDFNMVAQIDIPAFQLTDSPDGFAFEVDEAWIDYSTIGNIEGIEGSLPANYNSPTLSSGDPRIQNTWKGFWMKDLKLRIPEYAGNVHGEERTMSAHLHNFIYDGQFTFSFRMENVMNLSANHDIEGSNFSIDTIYMDVVQNSFERAAMKGKIGIPMAGENEQLNYKLLFDDDHGAGTQDTLQFIIEPRDNLTLPMFLAQADLLPTSNFKLLIEPEVVFSMDLNAHISISDRFNPGSIDLGALSLEIPGVMIEHLAYNSKTGFDDSNFTYSPASPQKNMSGFPLSLDGFSFSFNNFNPTISLTPKLTLTSGEDGISATTTIVIKSALRPKAAGIKKIELTEVTINKITLDAHISTIGLKGELEFYNESGAKGTRGKIDVTLPAGISARLAADFGTYMNPGITDPTYNTAQWYDYWYVDGLVGFGETGIPVFSGLQLYGLGGGVSSHMTKTGSLPTINPNAGDAPQPSGGVYRPNFNTALGLNFKAIFGSSDGGRAFNFDVTLGAEFSNSGGMTYFGFSGNVRSMADDLNDSDTPITGYVSVSYHNPGSGDNGEEHIEGQLFMTANFYDVVKGGTTITNPPADYTGDLNNAFVWASFYTAMNRDYWYFNMGTPANRGKLEVLDIATFSSYLMVGHDVPSTLPSPPQSFMDIYNDQEDGIAGGGDVSSLMSEQSRPALPAGSGFAFGSYFEASIEGSPSIFYYDIGMVIGYDINLTHNIARTCAEYGSDPGVPEVPGVNNWYATGQFYAGIHGEFGVEVDLMFYSGRYSILDASAAILLQGGLPNPVWASGGGRIRYRILHGLVKGTYKFDATVGHKCTPSISSSGMLDAISFIQDMKPSNGTNNVDVQTLNSVVFAMEVNEIFELPVDDGVRRFKPYVKSWTFKEKNGPNVPCLSTEYNDENIIASKMPQDMLKAQTRYTQKLEVRVKEYYANGTHRDVQKNGHAWKEIKEATFRTGNAPQTISDRNVLFAYPFKFQKHFLKGETENGFGYIVQKQGTPSLFPEYGDANGHFNYIARFTPLDAGEETHVDLPLTIVGNRIVKFRVSSLQNSTAYSVQIIAKTNPTEEERIQAMMNSFQEMQESRHQEITFHQQDINIFSQNGSTASYRKRTLPGSTTASPHEKVLYNYYFQTSQFNTFEAKSAANTPSSGSDENSQSSMTVIANYVHNNSSSDDGGFNVWEATVKPDSYSSTKVFLSNSGWEELPEYYDYNPHYKPVNGASYRVDKLVNLYLNPTTSESDNAYAEYPTNNYFSVFKHYVLSPYRRIYSGSTHPVWNLKQYFHGYNYNWNSIINSVRVQGARDNLLSTAEMNELLGNSSGSSSTKFNYLYTPSTTMYITLPHYRVGKHALTAMRSSLAATMNHKILDYYSYKKIKNLVPSHIRSKYYRVINTNPEVMDFPHQDSNTLAPVSFILQYRYPSSSSAPTGATATLRRGTSARIQTGSIEK